MALLCGTMAIAQKRSCCVPWRRYLRALAQSFGADPPWTWQGTCQCVPAAFSSNEPQCSVLSCVYYTWTTVA